ncbi:MAG: hypothetical protein Q9170_008023, partial [Blastenia crenularia]
TSMHKYNSKKNLDSKKKEMAIASIKDENALKGKPHKTSPFELHYEEVQGNWDHQGRHWEMGQALGISEFDDYWDYLSGGQYSSSGVDRKKPYSMAVTPILDSSGTPVELVVNNMYLRKGQGMAIMEYTFSLPCSKHLNSAKEWKRQHVTIVKPDEDLKTMTVGDFVGIQGMTIEDMMSCLNSWIYWAPFNEIYNDVGDFERE